MWDILMVSLPISHRIGQVQPDGPLKPQPQIKAHPEKADKPTLNSRAGFDFIAGARGKQWPIVEPVASMPSIGCRER